MEPPKSPPGSVIYQKDDKTLIYCNKRIQNKVSKRKGTLGGVERKLGTSSQESFTSGDTQDLLHFSSNGLWQNIYQGCSVETQFLRVLLRASQVGPHCPERTKIPDSQRKASVQCKTHYFVYQNIKLPTLNIYNFYCQLYCNKAGRGTHCTNNLGTVNYS